MAADYPGSLVSFTTKSDGVDWVLAAHINDIQNEIEAIETELGTDVAGSMTDLKTRLAVVMNDNGTLKAFTMGGDITGNGHSITNLDEVILNSVSGDYKGVKIYGYDDVSAEYLALYLNPDGEGVVKTTQKLHLISDTDVQIRLGDVAGTYECTVRDSSYNVVFSINSDGDTQINGALDVGGTVDMKRTVEIVLLDGDTDLSAGDDFPAFYWTVPALLNGYNITDVDFAVETASSSGAPSFQLHNVTRSVDILSTNCTIDANELTSYTAATPAVINTSQDHLATGDQIRFDCDNDGTGTKGCTVIITVEKP